MRILSDLQETLRLLQKLDLAPNGKAHDKKCWFCAQCGDDLLVAIKTLDKAIDAYSLQVIV